MADEYLEHVTTEGDRWDLLADRYYGDPHLYGLITAANPHVALTPHLGAGVHLAIPVLEVEETVSTSELPPWKR